VHALTASLLHSSNMLVRKMRRILHVTSSNLQIGRGERMWWFVPGVGDSEILL